MGQAKQRKRWGNWEEDERTLQQRAAQRAAMMPVVAKGFAAPPPEPPVDMRPGSPASMRISDLIRLMVDRTRKRSWRAAHRIFLANGAEIDDDEE